MPDLLVHVAAARLAATPLRNPLLVLLVLLGTSLPDVVTKFLLEIVDTAYVDDTATHSLAGIVVLSYAFCFFLEERIRAMAFLALLAGAAVHVGLDSLKTTVSGGLRLFVPVSDCGCSAGLFGAEDSIYAAPVALLILGAYALRRRTRRV